MRIHYLQHVPYESLGSIAAWAEARGHEIRGTLVHDGEALPPLDSFDWLIVMGGPMGVYEEELHPWLVPEKAFIRAAIDAGKIVLGICLGSQLIAEVLGGKVVPAAEKEIGWWPIQKSEEGSAHPLLQALRDDFTVFHWHGDTWSLPAGAQLLAGSEGCRHQAFSYGDRVVGLQFHLEATEEIIEAFLVQGSTRLPLHHRFVQTPATMREGYNQIDANNRAMAALLDQLAGSQG